MDGKAQILRRLAVILAAAMLFALAVLICPLNYFAHGFDSKVPEYTDIAPAHILGKAALSENGYSLEFTPAERHFAGFQLLLKQPQDNPGNLVLEIQTQQGVPLSEETVNLRDIPSEQWYKIMVDAKLEAQETYVLTIRAEGFQAAPEMILVEEGFRGQESREDGLLIGYAYKMPTFSGAERILLCLLLLTLAGWLLLHLFKNVGVHKQVCVAMLLVILMSWNYFFGTLDPNNAALFDQFQSDSENLAVGPIEAKKNHVTSPFPFGLGIYSDAKSMDVRWLFNEPPLSRGYHQSIPGTFAMQTSGYSRMVAAAGNYVQFSNGTKLQIVSAEVTDHCTMVTLDTDVILSEAEYGMLSETVFYNAEGTAYPVGVFEVYTAQYGLHGKIFGLLAGFLNADNMRLLCSMAAAAVFVLICWLIGIKYNILAGAIWYITFLLSPWITNFAKNLYWVEFTWFLPMVVGLLCSIHIEKRWCRCMSYAGAFGTVALKCLCGYEYVSVIMLGLIAFLLVDMVESWFSGERKKAFLLLKTTFLMGVAAVAGFFAALLLHAQMVVPGDSIEGIRVVVDVIVRKRTTMTAGIINDYSGAMFESLSASVWEVLRKYFCFETQIITGLDGNLFSVLCLLPLGIFGLEYSQKKMDWRGLAMYVVFFGAAISWHVLMKGHSYIHTHMNFVLWYFGFVQTCLYVIASRLAGRKC